ncbi:dTDP-glucose 4,6-dehydratase [Fulvitalea axinellae]|uniref:dTDP-glucose 4,6-dehydratase n=1 Tax=Fulvitalea axinellae TaxID=1182444 RepID=A0AAU9CCE7_9BACT|nr:dTDP-glucose 4,6-dehydratase [Fulvitalea axinellae]
MKVLVTGGAGYVGTDLVRTLAMRPEVTEVRIYDNLSRKNHNLFLGATLEGGEKVRFVCGDILDSRKLAKALQGIDVVYHLAACVSTPFSHLDSHVYEQVNHWGTADLVSAVEESDVKRFVYLSSASVYGKSATAEFTEESVPFPKTVYGISKLKGEEHVRRLFSKMDTYILRCANVYGYSKSMRFDAVINRFMFESHFNGRISIDGNGKQFRAFVHVDTVTQALGGLLSETVPSGMYNLADKNLRIIDVVDALKEVYPELEFMFVNQHLELESLKVSPESSLREYLNFSKSVDFVDELKSFKESFSFCYNNVPVN